MKRFIKKILISVCACSFVLAMPLSVSARTQITRDTFDYEFYLNKYPDIAEVYSLNDKDEIWSHFYNIGRNENRVGRVAVDKLITYADFDYLSYAADNSDVAAAVGTDKKALWTHYTLCGQYENRTAKSTSAEVTAQKMIYSIADSITNDSMSDEEKVKAVHDYIVKNTAYDIDNLNAGTIPYKSYHLEGVIIDHVAVCNGYAESFDVFMEVLGIPCDIVYGIGTNSRGSGPHAWNRVLLNGTWYYIDCTWDDPLPDRANTVYWYKYYLTTDATFGNTHVTSDYR